MPSFLERYQQGSCEQVWRELVELRKGVREEPLYSDALAVARETMRRVRTNIELLIPRLRTVGYRFGYAWASAVNAEDVQQEPPLLGTPLPDIQKRIAALEKVGAILPLSLRAFYEIVGAVNFVGICTPGMDRFEYGDEAIASGDDEGMVDEELDPLYVQGFDDTFTPGSYLSLREEDDGLYTLIITQDASSKYYMEGAGASLIEVPSPYADAQLLSETGYGITFVEYLRNALRGGGLPGVERCSGLGEKTLAFVTEPLLPF